MAEGFTSGWDRSILPAKTGIDQFTIFLSYGDDVVALKDRVKRLIEGVFNRQLAHTDWPITFGAIDWRDLAAKRAPEGGKVNDHFVEAARNSSVTMVLLADRLPPGSKEELLAVLEEAKKVDLKVFWLNAGQEEDEPTEVAEFLDEHKDDFTYTPLPGLDSEETWDKLVSNLVAILLEALPRNR